LSGSLAVHVLGQWMPPPLTVPLPVTLTESAFVVPAAIHAALTDLSLVMCTEHDCAVPLHAPPQPLNDAPAAGVWNSVSVDPVSTVHAQLVVGVVPSVPQSMMLPCGAFSGALTKPLPFVLS